MARNVAQQKNPVVFSGTEGGTAEKPGGSVAQNMAQQKNLVVFDGTEHGTAEQPGGFMCVI